MTLALSALVTLVITGAQENPPKKEEPTSTAETVEVTPASAEAEVGETLRFRAVGKDGSGKPLEEPVASWFAAPFDVASADNDGFVVFHDAGKVRVGAVIGGKTGYAEVMVKASRVAKVEVRTPESLLVVGGDMRLEALAFTARGVPRERVDWSWISETPAIASVDASGFAVGRAPGRAVFRAAAEGSSGKLEVDVVPNPAVRVAIEPQGKTARTGDVVRFQAMVTNAAGEAIPNPSLRFSVTGSGASIDPDGGFVAERPGAYTVLVSSGDRMASTSIRIEPRNVEREIEVVGRAAFTDLQAAEQWIFGDYAYLSSIDGELRVYDISDPANPKQVHTLEVDARIINDVSVGPSGRVGVMTREGASNRKNGIVFLDTEDPSKPRILSEFTETVTGGVHSAFIDDHYVYLTDDATGSMRIIDFRDPRGPRQVARWEVPNPEARTIEPTGEDRAPFSAGRYLHDVYVKDGLAYLAYWRDGLVILDVGAGIAGGSPEKPELVSQLRFNYHELYGDDWLAGAHAVFRYKNYLYVGDEGFPRAGTCRARTAFPSGCGLGRGRERHRKAAQGRRVHRRRGGRPQHLGRGRHPLYGLLQRRRPRARCLGRAAGGPAAPGARDRALVDGLPGRISAEPALHLGCTAAQGPRLFHRSELGALDHAPWKAGVLGLLACTAALDESRGTPKKRRNHTVSV
jgi:hypothetical protein